MSAKTKRLLLKLPISLVLLLIAAASIYPMLYAVNAAFKSRRDYVMQPFSLVTHPVTENFVMAWRAAHFDRYLLNSLIVTVGGVIVAWFVCALAGFAFSKLRFRGSRALFIATLTGMMVPVQVILYPFYKTVVALHLTDQYVGLILVYAAFAVPFGTYMMASYYRGIPNEIIEAARVDGASFLQIFLRIMLPLAKPASATLSIINFLWMWKEVLLPLLVMQRNETRTLMVGITILKGQYDLSIPLFSAALTLASIPVIAVFLFFQAQLTKGMTVGAVKT